MMEIKERVTISSPLLGFRLGQLIQSGGHSDVYYVFLLLLVGIINIIRYSMKISH